MPDMSSIDHARAFRAARLLFFLNTAIWLLFGTLSLAGLGARGAGPVTLLVVAGLMLGNAAAMVGVSANA